MARFGQIRITGLRQTDAALSRLGRKGPKTLASALFQVAEEVIGKAKQDFVPVDLGHLRNSGFVELPKISGAKVTVEAGFGGPAGKGNIGSTSNKISVGYAIVVHENPRSGRTGGVSPKGKKYKTWSKVGQWKYLEQPFNEAQRNMDRRLADLIGRAEPRFR